MTEIPGRRERKKDATRRAIAQVALRLFLDRGFDRVTVAEIAEAADVSTNTVFNYFPTKEGLFFSSCSNSEAELAGLCKGRKSGEPVTVFLRRYLDTRIEQYLKAPMTLDEVGLTAAIRRVFQDSPVLQVHKAEAARRATDDGREVLAAGLAKDAKANADDLTPQLVAAQAIAICAMLFQEAELRRRSGEKPERTQAALRAGVEAALNLLEKGIGTYGAKKR